MRKLTKNKIAKGLVSLITIIILLSSILATTFVYENNITANVIREISINSEPTAISIKEVNDIKELSNLNEGWYQITNGYVYYLEHFDSYAPLYIRVRNSEQQNGILGVEEDGTILFNNGYSGLLEKEVVDEESEEVLEEKTSSLIQFTGQQVKTIPSQSIPEKSIVERIIFDRSGINYDFIKDKNGNWYEVEKNWLGITTGKLKVITGDISKYIESNVKRYIRQGDVIVRRIQGQPQDKKYTSYNAFITEQKEIERVLKIMAKPEPSNSDLGEVIFSRHATREQIAKASEILNARSGIQKIIDSPTSTAKDLAEAYSNQYATREQKSALSTAVSEKRKIQEILQLPNPTATDLEFVFIDAYYVTDEEKTKLAERAQILRAAGNKEVIEFSKQLPDLLEEWAEPKAKPKPAVPTKPKPIVAKKGDAYEVVAADDATRIVRYLYRNAPQATVADIVKQVFNVDELDPIDLENYRITVDSAEVRLAKDPSGKYQFYRVMDVDARGNAKLNTKRFVMKDNAIITIHDKYYEEQPAVVTPSPTTEIPTPPEPAPPAVTQELLPYEEVEYAAPEDVRIGGKGALYVDSTADFVIYKVEEKTYAVFRDYPKRAYQVIPGYRIIPISEDMSRLVRIYNFPEGESIEALEPLKPLPEISVPYLKVEYGGFLGWDAVVGGKGAQYEDSTKDFVVYKVGDKYYAVYIDAPLQAYEVVPRKEKGIVRAYDFVTWEGISIEPLKLLPTEPPLKVEVIKPAPVIPAELPPHLIKLAEDLQKKGATSEQTAAILQRIEPSDKVRISKDSQGRTYVILVKQDTEDVYDSKGNLVIIARLSETGEVKKIDRVNVGVEEITNEDAKKIISDAVFIQFVTPPPELDIYEGLTEEYRETIDKYIQSEEGSPSDWMLDSNGNFICVNDKGCGFKGKEFFYNKGQTFAPPGGYYPGKRPDEDEVDQNLDALEVLKAELEKEAPEPLPIPPPPPERKRVLSVAELKKDLPVADSKIKSVKTDPKTGITTVELEDKRTITLKPGQSLDTETGEPLQEFKVKPELTVPIGPPLRPKEEKPIISGTAAGRRIDVFAPDEKGMHTIKIDGVEALKIHKDLLPKLTHQNWDGVISEDRGVYTLNVREKTKDTFVSVSQDGTQVVRTETYDEKRQKLTIISETIRLVDGTTTATTTLNLQEPAKLQKTETVTYASGLKKEIKYDQGREDLTDKASITFTSSKGDKITMKDTALKSLPVKLDEQSRLMQAAFDAGITQIDKYENGFQQGSRRVIYSEGTAVGISGNRLVSSYSTNGISRTYENVEVRFPTDVPEYTFRTGYKIVEKRGDDLVSIEENLEYRKSLKFVYEGNNKDGYSKVEVYELLLPRPRIEFGESELSLKQTQIPAESQQRKGTLNLQKIDDVKSPLNGMYEFKTDVGRLYYFEPSYGPFGLVGLNWYIKNADGTVEKLSEDRIRILGLPDKTLLEKAKDQARLVRKELTDAQKASQAFFADVERVFTEFQGLGYYATLFFDADSLLQWRENVDRAFATLYLGTEYWASAICSQSLDGEDVGIAYAETPQGLAQIGAHVEATRTPPIIDESGSRQFIYKITFNVRNGDYAKDLRAPEEMNINIELRGEKTVNVFKKGQNIKRGSTFGRLGRSAIVQDSKTLFNEVCITFDNIPFRWKLSDKILCNKIQESSAAPTKIEVPTPTTAGGGGATADEINDF